MARLYVSAQRGTAVFCDVHPTLAELCSRCPYRDCTYNDGCQEYRAVRESLNEGNEVELPEDWQPILPNPSTKAGGGA